MESDLESLGWGGSMITGVSNYQHLGYPLDVDVANVQLIDWIENKSKD